MFAIAEKRNHINKNPFENKPFPQHIVTEWWTDDYVYNKLIPAIRSYKANTGKTQNAKLTELKIRLTYTTGLRPGIIHRVRRKDVKITEDEVIVNTDAKIPKSSKWQHHAAELLNEKCKEMFIKHINKLDIQGIKPEDLILETPMTTTGYQQYRYHIVQACKQAKIPYLSPHKAKHGAITKMAQAGMTSNKICKITGNRTARLIDEVYTHISQKDARNEAYKALNSE